MAQLSDQSSSKREMSKGTWTIDEDQRLAQVVEVHGPGRWKSIVAKSGLNRCAKSCRLRWVNYLRPNIRRGSISADEEDLIIRLHKLLGNRWSLIAGRLPGRTDNDVKNYWNSHLKKKIMKQKEPQNTTASKDVLQEESVRPRTGSVVEMTATVLKEGEADISRRSDDREVTKASEEEEDKNGVFDCCGSIDDEAAWNSSEWTSQFLLKMDEGWSESSPDQ